MGKPKKRSESLMQFAVQLYGELGSGNAVARRLGISPPTVYLMLHEAGVPGVCLPAAAERRRALVGTAQKNAAKDYADGVPLAEIRTKYGVGNWAIRTAAEAEGVPARRVGGRKKEVTEPMAAEMVRLYTKENWAQEQIAAKFACHQTTVSKTLRAAGVPSGRNCGENHGSWTGGRTLTSLGYVLVRSDDGKALGVESKSGYSLEHRLAMARALGRPLGETETVHHINGNTQDNRIENLQLRQGRHGKGVRLACADCGSHNVLAVELEDPAIVPLPEEATP